MKNAVSVATLVAGLAFGSASASFAGNVDAGASPRSGVPTVGEQGANTARGVHSGPHSHPQSGLPTDAEGSRMKQDPTSKNRRKKNEH
ncbi:hypothetical protein [Nitrobacter vulgaris]|uniref:hypothetical protein n=1 Tax=Nitrobacter vulgaris TaxID=29421 RepID=UPI0011167E6D|nr:hypothetical protein [Nitrobacter vulgaris]